MIMLARAGLPWCEVLRDLPVPAHLECLCRCFYSCVLPAFPRSTHRPLGVAGGSLSPPLTQVCDNRVKSLRYRPSPGWQRLFR